MGKSGEHKHRKKIPAVAEGVPALEIRAALDGCRNGSRQSRVGAQHVAAESRAFVQGAKYMYHPSETALA